MFRLSGKYFLNLSQFSRFVVKNRERLRKMSRSRQQEIEILVPLKGEYIKGKFTGRELSSNPLRGWIYTRGTRWEVEEGRRESGTARARGIAIGGHSSIHGINTLELMKAPREQQASGRNVNRDRPASDPFSCTANSQGPHPPLPFPSLIPLNLPRCPRCTFKPATNPMSSVTHTIVPSVTILYVYIYTDNLVYSFLWYSFRFFCSLNLMNLRSKGYWL